jgi:hypothetical protein
MPFVKKVKDEVSNVKKKYNNILAFYKLVYNNIK